MNGLQKAGLLLEQTRRSFVSNTLVIVVRPGAGLYMKSAKDILAPSIKRLALADPAAVPAGIYAKKYLEKMGVWESLKDRIVPTQNVRAALAAVEAGNADAAIVYRTDARISKAVSVAFEVPSEEGPAISYSFAVLKESRSPRGSQRFLEYLESPAAVEAFKKQGFVVKEKPAP
jgi:molybdate transport system substrate-binding protein